MPSSMSAGSSDIAASCRPADQPSVRIPQHADLVGAQLHPVQIEQCRRLLLGEGEVTGADLGELAADPQSMQPQGRVGSAEHHQPQRRRQVVDQLPERFQHRVAGDLVEVVQHQNDRRRQLGQSDPDLQRLLIAEPRRRE